LAALILLQEVLQARPRDERQKNGYDPGGARFDGINSEVDIACFKNNNERDRNQYNCHEAQKSQQEFFKIVGTF
jgi:hypothetical protein